MRRILLTGLILLSPNLLAAPPEQWLENDQLRYGFSTDKGGRGLTFSVNGQPNLLKIGAAVHSQPNAAASPTGDNVPYLGHIVWVGPQQDWWQQQQLNPQRREAKADWPPDPFTVLAHYTIAQQDNTSVRMTSPASPVTGLAMTKHSTLDGNRLHHEVVATNARDEAVSWDVWFNTRVHADTRVFVPVADFNKDLRLKSFNGAATTVDAERKALGYFDFSRDQAIQGKAFIQPAAGWMAAFNAGQLFVIEFPLQNRDRIHPQQGQVELYLDYNPGAPDDGLLELEVHSPYQQLNPGDSMSASETWRAWTYDGDDSVTAQLAFLRALGYH